MPNLSLNTPTRSLISFLGALLLFIFLVLADGAQGSCTSNSDCLNGGTCHDLGATDHVEVVALCTCATGYIGTNCKEKCPLICQNGGQCDYASDEHALVPGATDYVCGCPQGYNGVLCQESLAQATIVLDESRFTILVGCLVGIMISLVLALSFMVLAPKCRRQQIFKSSITRKATIDVPNTEDVAELGKISAVSEYNTDIPPEELEQSNGIKIFSTPTGKEIV